MEVGGVEVDVGETGLVERRPQVRLDLLTCALADPAHHVLADAARPAQHDDLPGGHAACVGLHHYGVEGLVDTAAWLGSPGEEAALAQPGNGQGEVTHLGGEQPLAGSVAVGRALIRAADKDHALCSVWW